VLLVDAQRRGFQVIVDDNDLLSIDHQLEGRTEIAPRLIVDVLLGDNGVLAENRDTLALPAPCGVAILVDGVERSVKFFLSHLVGGRLLEAHDVGILLLDILEDGVGVSRSVFPPGKIPHVIRQHLDGSGGWFLRDVDGPELPYGHIADDESRQGNQRAARLEYQPKDEEPEIDDQKGRKRQSCVAQQWERVGMQAVRIAHREHQDDARDVGPGNHLQGKYFQFLDHFLLWSKSVCFSSLVRLSYPLLRILSSIRSVSSCNACFLAL